MNNTKTESGIVIAALFLTTIFAVHCVTPEQETTTPVTEGFIQSSDGVELYYQAKGVGSDYLIMLHGGPGADSGYLAPDLEPLEKSFTLIYYDQRGSGRSTLVSEPEALTVDAHVADLESVRQHFGIDRLSLFGHSWGALLATFYALEHPEKISKIVLASPASPRYEPYYQQLRPNILAWMDNSAVAEVEQLRSARQDTAINAIASCDAFWEVYIRGYFADPYDMETIRNMRGSFCTSSEEALRNSAVVSTHTMESVGIFDLRDQLQAIDVPVLIITGTKDIFPVEAMQEWEAAYPNAQLVLLEHAGHFPQIERPEEFFSAVKEFIED